MLVQMQMIKLFKYLWVVKYIVGIRKLKFVMID